MRIICFLNVYEHCETENSVKDLHQNDIKDFNYSNKGRLLIRGRYRSGRAVCTLNAKLNHQSAKHIM